MILAMNTSTKQFGVALMKEDGTLIGESLISPKSGHFREFMTSVAALVDISGIDMKDLQGIAVSIGPGSFTGLRVGLALAKGMAQCLDIGLIGVSTLASLANQLSFTDHPVCPIIDSRKGEYFTALFQWSDHGNMRRIHDDVCLKIGELFSFIKGPTLFIGNDFNGQTVLIKKVLGDRATLAPPSLWNLKASAVGALALKRFHARDFDNLHHVVPIYMRPPDIRFSSNQTKM